MFCRVSQFKNLSQMATPATRWAIAGAGAISSEFVKALKILPETEHKVKIYAFIYAVIVSIR